jgi:UDP:flavonoid glycosyltransferase YjiC (YdhE family)
MPAADVVICHGGHGTVARALAAGAPLLVCPSVGDMGENAARVAWSGAGLSVPRRMLSPRSIRLATRRLLGEPKFHKRALAVAEWSQTHDGGAAAADLVEDAVRQARIESPVASL